MCGIAGYVDFAMGAPQQRILTAMTTALARRGPDAHGVLIEGPCGLAHTRLSIIDVEGSPQPMAFADSSLVIVYNGETYNYQLLREDLAARGVTLQTMGDTEVMLRWLGLEWADALPRFDAMFAFGAWDRANERLLLARDAVGEKPLFYATPRPGLIVFGSEPKALLEHPEVDVELDEDALRQALRFRAVYGEGHLHAGIRKLEPGCYLEFSRSGLRIGRHHSLKAEVEKSRARNSGASTRELVQRCRDVFMESVRERLIADVPVGVFLSGGLDSSLIAAAMRKIRPDKAEIRTFSVGFEGDPFTELPFAEQVAAQFDTVHQSISIGPESYIARLSELTQIRDGPVSQPADVAIAEMSRLARQSVKVVLSGEGADEVFGGYPKHAYADVPWILRKTLAVAGPDRAAALFGMLGGDARRAMVAFRAMAGGREIDRLVQWFSYLDAKDLRALLPGLRWNEADLARTTQSQSAALAEFPSETALFRMQATDYATWLPDNMLERGDRMTMAEGLEVRPPFLDKELVAFGMGLPDNLKVRKGVGKWIVRQWASDMLPAHIIARRKWGFRVPLAQWFRGPMREMLYARLTGPDGLVARYGDPAAVRNLLDAHCSGRIDASESLWTLLTAEIWFSDVYLERMRQREGHRSDTIQPPVAASRASS
jgi:asparagine synthase (glutamine-hydrolysing)